MRTTLNFNGKAVNLECNAATPLVGKRLAGFDFLRFIQSLNTDELSENVDKLERMACVMALQAEKPFSEVIKVDFDEAFLEFLNRCEIFELVSEVLPKVVELFGASNETTSQQKNA